MADIRRGTGAFQGVLPDLSSILGGASSQQPGFVGNKKKLSTGNSTGLEEIVKQAKDITPQATPQSGVSPNILTALGLIAQAAQPENPGGAALQQTAQSRRDRQLQEKQLEHQNFLESMKIISGINRDAATAEQQKRMFQVTMKQIENEQSRNLATVEFQQGTLKNQRAALTLDQQLSADANASRERIALTQAKAQIATTDIGAIVRRDIANQDRISRDLNNINNIALERELAQDKEVLTTHMVQLGYQTDKARMILDKILSDGSLSADIKTKLVSGMMNAEISSELGRNNIEIINDANSDEVQIAIDEMVTYLRGQSSNDDLSQILQATEGVINR